MRQSVEFKVKNKIKGHGVGWCFTPVNFLDLGSNESIRYALSHLHKQKIIRRLAQGIYDYPKKHEVLGTIPPDLNAVARTIAEKNGVQIQPAGAHAANLVGLSEQVPGRLIFLTEGPSRKVKIGNQEIVFKKTTSKVMASAGTREGLVIQALKNLGRDHIDKAARARIRRFLQPSAEKEIRKNLKFAPIWVRIYFRHHGDLTVNTIYLLPKNERELFFRTAADALKISLDIIEKDYWVVWTLERLFALRELKTHLTFKGGTSLSKVYGIIDRFSEDIDLSIEREFSGLTKIMIRKMHLPKKKQRSALENLSKACSEYVQHKMLADLMANIAEKLGATGDWQVEVDAEDPDAQTLFFEYPRIAAKGGYIRPLVKIEMGARSEHWPISEHTIRSYAKEALGDKIQEDDVRVRVLNAERTFWEKATILHQYAHLPDGKMMASRISRHYYFNDLGPAQSDKSARVHIIRSNSG